MTRNTILVLLIIVLAIAPSIKAQTPGNQILNRNPTADEVIELAISALTPITKYHFRHTNQDCATFVMDGVFDIDMKATYFNMSIDEKSSVDVDVYWVDKKACGLPHHINRWFPVSVPSSPVSYLHALSEVLRLDSAKRVKPTVQDEKYSVLYVVPDSNVIRTSVQLTLHSLLAQLIGNNDKNIELRKHVLNSFRDFCLQTEFRISKSTYLIHDVIIKATTQDLVLRKVFHFDNFNDPDIVVTVPQGAMDAEGPPVSMGALLMEFKPWESNKSLWGWSENNHCMMTDQALRLVRNNDPDKRYYELYSGYPMKWGWRTTTPPPPSYGPPFYNPKVPSDSEPGIDDHPCLVGAWAEDAWDNPRLRDMLYPSAIPVAYSTYRSTNHFGGEGIGLRYRWYFPAAHIPKPTTGNCFASARDWGWNGDNSGDRMNFQGAIEVYNNYTFEGAKEAYLRIGHVLHLLQDLAQPDHAGRVDHASSALTDPEAFQKYHVCSIAAAEAALIAANWCASTLGVPGVGAALYWACIAASVTATVAICQAYINESEVGFEWLIREKWNYSELISKLDVDKLQETPSEPNPYNRYFKEMQDYSLASAKSRNIDCPLGLDNINLIGFSRIPSLNPEIKLGSSNESLYLHLANDVIGRGTNLCAGLLEHFFEVVNHPPYVQEVVVYQDTIEMIAKEVTAKVFSKDPDKVPEPNIIYRAWWNCIYGTQDIGKKLLYREMSIVKDVPLDPELFTYVLVRVTSNMKHLRLTVRNELGKEVEATVMQVVAPTSSDEYASLRASASHEFPLVAYYFARIAGNIFDNCGSIGLEFSGEDMEAHYVNRAAGRVEPGTKLDSDPVTVAVAGLDFPHNWISDSNSNRGYEPGTDKNHFVRAYAPDVFEPNNNINEPAVIDVRKTGVKTIDCSFHDKSDQDYYIINYPTNTVCRTDVLQPATVVISPSTLELGIESNTQDVVLSVYHDDSRLQYTFYAGNDYMRQQRNYMVTNTEGNAGYLGIEDLFPDGKVRFKVEPKEDASGRKKPGCYVIRIWAQECKWEHKWPRNVRTR